LKEKHKREGADSWAPLARDQPAPHSSVLRRTGGRPAGARLGGPQRPWLSPAAACRRRGSAEPRPGRGGGAGRRVGRRRGAPQRAGGGGGVRGAGRAAARGRSGRATANRRRRRAAPRSGGPGSPRAHSGGPRAGAGRAGGVRAGRAARSAAAIRRRRPRIWVGRRSGSRSRPRLISPWVDLG